MDTNDDEEYYLPKYQLSTTYDEEKDETKDPTEKSKPSHIVSSKIETDIPPTISKLPIVATRALVNIVTRAPTEKEKTPFKYVTTTVFPSAKVPTSLS